MGASPEVETMRFALALVLALRTRTSKRATPEKVSPERTFPGEDVTGVENERRMSPGDAGGVRSYATWSPFRVSEANVEGAGASVDMVLIVIGLSGVGGLEEAMLEPRGQ
jgi:hypothetical protein